MAVETEANRHNTASEEELKRYNTLYMAEFSRHNMATEKEATRHNMRVETETERANKASEAIRRDANAIQKAYNEASIGLGYAQLSYQRERDQKNLAYQYQVLGETRRHNVYQEELQRSGQRETARHNQEMEYQAQYSVDQNVALGYAKLAETIQHNRNMEATNERLANYSLSREIRGWASLGYTVGSGVYDRAIDWLDGSPGDYAQPDWSPGFLD
jgi:Zn-finger domain-containing protein